MARYVPCDESDVPKNVCFDVPGANQGQTVEVAYGCYGTPGRARGEADIGDPFKRVTDRSDGSVRYYKLASRA